MAEPGVSPAVQALLQQHVQSYEQLEVLLLLRLRPDELWTAAKLSKEIGLAESLVEDALRFLCRENLLSVEIGAAMLLFKYGPRPPERAGLVDQLAQAYADHRLDVMRLMTTNALDRLRTHALRTFSDSFLLGHKKGKDG